MTTYESTASDLDALEDLNLEEDGSSDEYVMVDDARDGKTANQRTDNYGATKKKYMHMLQQVADRQTSEVRVELDDLDNVWNPLDQKDGSGEC